MYNITITDYTMCNRCHLTTSQSYAGPRLTALTQEVIIALLRQAFILGIWESGNILPVTGLFQLARHDARMLRPEVSANLV